MSNWDDVTAITEVDAELVLRTLVDPDDNLELIFEAPIWTAAEDALSGPVVIYVPYYQ